MRRHDFGVERWNGPALHRLPDAQTVVAAQDTHVVALRRAPTLLARARGRLRQEAGSGELPPRSLTPPPTSTPGGQHPPVVPRPAPAHRPALRAAVRPDDAA